MARTQHTVRVSDIPEIVDDPARGEISLVGSNGGLSLIVGDIESSGLVMGTLAIETEHGVVYLDPETDTQISEDDGRRLVQRGPRVLFGLNTSLTTFLFRHFGWRTWRPGDSEEVAEKRDEALNDLVHQVAESIDDFLGAFPDEEKRP